MAVLWPYPPAFKGAITESLLWRTSRRESLTGLETRLAHRERPRYRVNFEALLTGQEARALSQQAAAQPERWLMPRWAYPMRITAADAGGALTTAAAPLTLGEHIWRAGLGEGVAATAGATGLEVAPGGSESFSAGHRALWLDDVRVLSLTFTALADGKVRAAVGYEAEVFGGFAAAADLPRPLMDIDGYAMADALYALLPENHKAISRESVRAFRDVDSEVGGVSRLSHSYRDSSVIRHSVSLPAREAAALLALFADADGGVREVAVMSGESIEISKQARAQTITRLYYARRSHPLAEWQGDYPEAVRLRQRNGERPLVRMTALRDEETWLEVFGLTEQKIDSVDFLSRAVLAADEISIKRLAAGGQAEIEFAMRLVRPPAIYTPAREGEAEAAIEPPGDGIITRLVGQQFIRFFGWAGSFRSTAYDATAAITRLIRSISAAVVAGVDYPLRAYWVGSRLALAVIVGAAAYPVRAYWVGVDFLMLMGVVPATYPPVAYQDAISLARGALAEGAHADYTTAPNQAAAHFAACQISSPANYPALSL